MQYTEDFAEDSGGWYLTRNPEIISGETTFDATPGIAFYSGDNFGNPEDDKLTLVI